MMQNKNLAFCCLAFTFFQTGCSSTLKKNPDNSESVKIVTKKEVAPKIEPYATTRAEKIITDSDFGKISNSQATEAFLLAKEFERNNDLTMAEKLYQVCFKRAPTLNTGLALIQVEIALQGFKEAKKVANYLSVAYPQEAEPIIWLIQISLMENKPQETKQILERAYQNFPNHEKIVILYAGYHKDQTEKILEKYIQKNTTSSYALLALSQFLAQSNKTQKALKYAKMAYKQDPNNFNAIVLTGQLEYILKNKIEAEKYFKQAFEKDNNNPSFSPDIRLQFIQVLILNQNYEDALKQLNILSEAKLDPNLIYYYMGVCYEGMQKYNEAMIQYEKVTAQSTIYPKVAKARVILYLQMKEDTKAKQLAQELPATFEKAQETEDALFRASVMAYFTSYQDAVDILNRAIELHPNESKLRLTRANYLLSISTQKAFQEAQEIINKWPNEADGFNFFGYTLLKHGKDDNKAKKLLEKANKIDLENAYYADSLGWFYYKTNDFKKAQTLFEKSNRLSGGEEPVILYHYAKLLLKMGKKQEALNHFEKTQKIISNTLLYFLSLDSELKYISEHIENEIKEVKNSLSQSASALQ